MQIFQWKYICTVEYDHDQYDQEDKKIKNKNSSTL